MKEIPTPMPRPVGYNPFSRRTGRRDELPMLNQKQKLPFFGLINSTQSELKDRPESVEETHVTQLMVAATDFFQKVALIDPRNTVIQLERDRTRPRIFYRNLDISTLSVLMVRSTLGVESPTRVLAHTLRELGCVMVDPVTRFAGSRASKTMSTLRRHQDGLGSDSFICFDLSGAQLLARQFEKQSVYPVITKPVHGYKGIGVEALHGTGELMDYAENHFHKAPAEPLLLQRLMEFVHEYRVLVVHRHCIGVVEKVKDASSLVANAARGGQFIPADVPEVVEFVRANCAKSGLMGVDVAVDSEGRFHVIEENRAPNWNHIQEALERDIAHEIMQRVYKSAKSKLRKQALSGS